MHRFDKTEWAWFSGLIDGEGCFTLNISSNGKYTKTPRVSPAFTIGMTNDGTWLHNACALLNSLGIYYQVKDKKNSNVTEIVVRGASNVRAICDAIYPYSTVKRDIVIKMLEYRGLSGRNQHIKPSYEEVRAIADLIGFIRIFNKKRNIPHTWTSVRFMKAFGYGEKNPKL